MYTMRFDLRPLRLTTGWSEPNAVVSRTLSVHEIEMKLNNIVRTITKNKKFSHVTCLYKKLNFLNLKDIYKLRLAEFMHKLFHNKLPNVFKTKFIKLMNIHSHEIRRPNQSNYFLPLVNKIACQYKLNYRGVKL